METKEISQTTTSKEELKIAWRYENLSIDENTTDNTNTYDLSIPHELTESQKSKTEVWYGTSSCNSDQTIGKFLNYCLSTSLAYS